ncbi:hypothetical protein [Yersinia phage vB_YenM_P778]
MLAGTRVKLTTRAKEKYSNCAENPHDDTGTVESDSETGHWQYVRWDNGSRNGYMDGELLVVNTREAIAERILNNIAGAEAMLAQAHKTLEQIKLDIQTQICNNQSR